jgi:2-keto-4-pentenoate hydratase/2-oxohepta-3-ene-1,7-dioic acid hydratase in catechol pathway
MKLVTFHSENGLETGLRLEQGVLPLRQAAQKLDLQPFPDMMRLLRQDEPETARLKAFAAQLQGKELPAMLAGCLKQEDGLRFGPCVPAPGKIICIGLNYRKHAEETGAAIPDTPVVFGKFSNALSAHNHAVALPEASRMVDYEAELAIVIGRRASNLKREEALGAVFGYCCANDFSARDLQKRTSQWLLGKTCEGFCPLGPYLVTADEVRDPNALGITSTVNGAVRQSSNTRDMIFSCDEILSYLSRHLVLEPGDVILTGTPEGVVFGMPAEEQAYLAVGDEVTVEVEGLGILRNWMC